VLGGTAALHAYRVWGAVIFWGGSLSFSPSLARALARARLQRSRGKRRTLNAQRSMSKSANSGRMSWPLVCTLIALIAAALVALIFWRIETWPARTARQSTAELERLGKNLRAAFVDMAHLQPRITINDRVYMEQTQPVSELILLSRRIE